jgi:hypothetical protein
MPVEVLRRDPWTGTPRQLGDLFLLRKGALEARCELWTHPSGWECRLFAGDEELVVAQACSAQEDVLQFGERWTAALGAKGWT